MHCHLCNDVFNFNKINKMENLKFKKDAEPIGISEDFFYMISGGGWCKPEVYLEEEDAKKVREAINVIKQYEQQGYDEGFFEEM